MAQPACRGSCAGKDIPSSRSIAQSAVAVSAWQKRRQAGCRKRRARRACWPGAGQPKSGTGTVEMIRHLKIARDTAVKARDAGHADAQGNNRLLSGRLREHLDWSAAR